MWDDGLNGCFCSEYFDHVVDAEEVLVSQGRISPARVGGRRQSIVK
jgi:hypothetical protein